MAFVAAAFTGLLLSLGCYLLRLGGTSGQHCILHCTGPHVQTPWLCRGIWLCAGLRANLFEVSLFCLPLGILCGCICIYGKRCHHLLPLPSSRSLCSAGSWAFPAERSLPRPAKRGGAGGEHPPLHLRYSLPQACLGGAQGIGAFFSFFFFYFFSWYLITSSRQTVGSIL